MAETRMRIIDGDGHVTERQSNILDYLESPWREHCDPQKLPLPYPHPRLLEALQLCIHPLSIKSVRIKLATDPFQHRLVLGMLGILYRFEEIGIAPDTTAIFGRAGTFASEAEWVVLPLVPRQDLFDEALVFLAITEIVLIEELELFASHQGRQGHPMGVFALHVLQHSRVAVRHPADPTLVEKVTEQVRASCQNHGVPLKPGLSSVPIVASQSADVQCRVACVP